MTHDGHRQHRDRIGALHTSTCTSTLESRFDSTLGQLNSFFKPFRRGVPLINTHGTGVRSRYCIDTRVQSPGSAPKQDLLARLERIVYPS